MTELVKKLERYEGIDIGWSVSNPEREYMGAHEERRGKNGFNGELDLDQMLAISYTFEPRPNVIVKGGPNSKWYIKLIPINEVHDFDKQKWRSGLKNALLWIIEW